jgi:hypothetical protein
MFGIAGKRSGSGIELGSNMSFDEPPGMVEEHGWRKEEPELGENEMEQEEVKLVPGTGDGKPGEGEDTGEGWGLGDPSVDHSLLSALHLCLLVLA